MDDPDVERVRRAHLNDLENVIPFLLLVPLYLSTGPNPWLAANLIRAFAAARILHTVAYLNEVRGRREGECGREGWKGLREGRRVRERRRGGERVWKKGRMKDMKGMMQRKGGAGEDTSLVLPLTSCSTYDVISCL